MMVLRTILQLGVAVVLIPGAAGTAEARSMRQNPATDVKRTTDTTIVVRRQFAAPPSRVFAAFTEPALLRQWMSAAGRTLAECEVDLRNDGRYRYVFRTSSGRSFVMYGTFREVLPGKRVVHTESYEGYDWPPLVTTMELEEKAGGTALVITIEYPSKAICDSDLPNIESGMPDGFTRLDALLAR
jgi:uncharacterized protein YndB with AHSA1/START domain